MNPVKNTNKNKYCAMFPARRYDGLIDYILNNIGRVPVGATVLYQRVVDDYGAVGVRSFQRYLRYLRETNQVVVKIIPHGNGRPMILYSHRPVRALR